MRTEMAMPQALTSACQECAVGGYDGLSETSQARLPALDRFCFGMRGQA